MNNRDHCLYESLVCIATALALPTCIISSILGRMIGNYLSEGGDNDTDGTIYTKIGPLSLNNKNLLFVDKGPIIC